MPIASSHAPVSVAEALLSPPTLAEQLDTLWAMTAAERVAAMWRGELALPQLLAWSSRFPSQVPLLGGEFAYITLLTPEFLEDSPARTTS